MLISGLGLYVYVYNNPELISGNKTASKIDSPTTNYDAQKAIAAVYIENLTGKFVLTNICTQCHTIQEVVTGSALADVYSRGNTDWLRAFINNSQKAIQNGDKEALTLFNQYNKTQMPPCNYTKAQIDSILIFIAFETTAIGQQLGSRLISVH